MERSRLLILGWFGLALLLAFPSFSLAIEIAPASAQDILAAMGPDAEGLTLKQESLPDLFALTAKHIEENPNQFFVEQPYLSGRWKGGKAVIEYARDMSYTMVSVYDKEGNRQRIYSVRTKYTEHIAHLKMASPARASSEEPAPETTHTVPANVPTPVPSANEPPAQKNNYAWDDAKGAYVPVAVVPDAVDEDVKATPSPTENKVVVASAVMMPPVVPMVTPPVAPPPEEASPPPEQPQTRRVRRIVKRRRHKAATQVKVGSTTWVEHSPDEDVVEEVVVYEEVPVTPKHTTKSHKVKPAAETTPAVEAPAASAASAQTPVAAAPMVVASLPSAAPPIAAVPAAAAPKPVSAPLEKVVLHPAPQGNEWVPRMLKDTAPAPKSTAPSPAVTPVAKMPVTTVNGAPVSEAVPSTEDLLDLKPTAPSPVGASKPSRSHQTPEPIPSVQAPASPLAPVEAPVPPVPPLTAQAPVSAAVPSTEELLASTPPAEVPKPDRHHRHNKAPPSESSPQTSIVAQASSAQVPSVQEPVTPVTTQAPAKETVPSAEDLLAASPQKTGPDTSASDAWVPKATPKPADTTPVPQERVTVAMVPTPAPVDNSVDNLLKMAGEGKSQMPHDGDAWVPHPTMAANPDADLQKQVTRLRTQEKMKSVQKAPSKIKHDVNNPEEGVLPVSSFEKFSGSMYGRHREYERRFYPGKRPHAKVPGHDFYVDEVDRKKEIHNVYYYLHQTGKAPKLVAVERHEKVSFLSNYDIEKEDKGKISTYH